MMPEISQIEVEVRPSRNYQTVGVKATVLFNPPVGIDEAKFEADVVYAELEQVAEKHLASIGGNQPQSSAPAAPVTSTVAVLPQGGINPNDQNTWPIAYKPNGAGSFRYLPTSMVSRIDFCNMAEQKLAALGIRATDVTVFDDRGGERGIEAGNHSYCSGKVKAKPDTALMNAMGGKAIVANIDFVDGGDVRVTLSRDGKTALEALKIAGQLAGTAAAVSSVPY
jgi:hypothetical protein